MTKSSVGNWLSSHLPSQPGTAGALYTPMLITFPGQRMSLTLQQSPRGCVSCRAALCLPNLPLWAGRAPAREPRAASQPDPPAMATATMTCGCDIAMASPLTTAPHRRPANPSVVPSDMGRATPGKKTPAEHAATGCPWLAPVPPAPERRQPCTGQHPSHWCS